jgi:hypothetical protein
MAETEIETVASHAANHLAPQTGGTAHTSGNSGATRTARNIHQHAFGTSPKKSVRRNQKETKAMKTYSKEHIEQLLTRFMEGTSTLEEEDLLARYFKEEKHLPEAWKAYREMFAMFDAERDKVSTSSMPKRKRLLPWYWTVAATITLLALVGIRLWNHEDEEVPLAVQKTETVEKIQVETEPVVLPSQLELKEKVELAVLPQTETSKKLSKPKPQKVIPVQKRHMTKEEVEEAIRILAEENARLKAQLDSAQREINEVRRQVMMAEMQACGYLPIYQEDGSVEFVFASQLNEPVEM